MGIDIFKELGLGSELAFLDTCAYGMIICSIIIGVLLLYVPGPYGRFASPAWGPAIGTQISWIIQEAPSFIIPVLLIFCTYSSQWKNAANQLIVTAFILHYFQRSAIFPFLIQPSKPTPFIAHFLALMFCTFNGYIQGRYHLHYAVFKPTDAYSIRVVGGLVIFLMGMCINIHSDHILRNLRKPGERGYKMPRGGMFEYVSAANYFGEIVEWTGYAIAASTVQSAAFAIFTAANLIPRALMYHKNYKQKFEDYPRERTAVLPYLL